MKDSVAFVSSSAPPPQSANTLYIARKGDFYYKKFAKLSKRKLVALVVIGPFLKWGKDPKRRGFLH
jgi:hypothetical protein